MDKKLSIAAYLIVCFVVIATIASSALAAPWIGGTQPGTIVPRGELSSAVYAFVHSDCGGISCVALRDSETDSIPILEQWFLMKTTDTIPSSELKIRPFPNRQPIATKHDKLAPSFRWKWGTLAGETSPGNIGALDFFATVKEDILAKKIRKARYAVGRTDLKKAPPPPPNALRDCDNGISTSYLIVDGPTLCKWSVFMCLPPKSGIDQAGDGYSSRKIVQAWIDDECKLAKPEYKEAMSVTPFESGEAKYQEWYESVMKWKPQVIWSASGDLRVYEIVPDEIPKDVIGLFPANTF